MKISSLDKLVAWIFVFTTGSLCWALNYTSICFLFYLLLAIANFFVRKNKTPLRPDVSFFYIVSISIIALISTILIGGKYGNNAMFGYIVIMVGSYLIISQYNFYYFRRLILDVLYYISLIGIPVFLLNELEVLPTITVVLRDGISHVLFFIYHLGWPKIFHRYAGIWHEPGACQILYNMILILYIDNFIKWQWNKGELKRIIVIIISVLLSMSTTGYLIFILLMVYCGFRAKFGGKYRWILKPIILLTSIIVSLIMFNSDVVSNKLDEDPETGLEATSKISRLNENLNMFEAFSEKPILGWGLGSKEQINYFVRGGNDGQSNGFLYLMSAWGSVWLIVFLITLFISTNKIFRNLPTTIFVVLLYIILFCSERYLEYPIAYLLLIKFKTYNQISADAKDKCNNSLL